MNIESVFDKNNDWIKKYFLLIDNRRKIILNKKECYCEKHHIICKFLFKQNGEKVDNSEDNLVNLTFKEHVLCHWYLLKYYESICDKLNYEKCILILHRMIIGPLGDHSKNINIDDIDFEILQEYRKKYSELMKCKKILLGKIQVYSQEGNLKYIKPEELDRFIENGYLTRDDYHRNKFQPYFDVIKEDINKECHGTKEQLYLKIKNRFPGIKYDCKYLFKRFNELFCWDQQIIFNQEKKNYMSICLNDDEADFWMKHNVFEIRKTCDYSIPVIARFKRNVLHGKVCYSGNIEVDCEDIEYIKKHSVNESALKFNCSYKEICQIRMELNIRRVNKRKQRKTRTKSQIMSDHHKNDVLMINIDNKMKKWVPVLKMNEFLLNNFIRYDDYLTGLYYEMMTDVIEHGFDYMREKHDYSGSRRAFLTLLNKYFSNEKDKVEKVYVILYGKKKKKMFTKEEKKYMDTHTFEECLSHLSDHDPKAIRSRMLKRGLVVPLIVYSSEEQDAFLKEHTIEECMKKFNWTREKVLRRRFKLNILQNTRRKFTSEEDDIIRNNTLKQAAELTGRTYLSVKRRRYVLAHVK